MLNPFQVQMWYCAETHMPSTQAECSAGADKAHLDCTFQIVDVTEIAYKQIDRPINVHIKVGEPH